MLSSRQIAVSLLMVSWAFGAQQGAPTPPAKTAKAKSIEYRNQRYGFCFLLPRSWTGYSIVESEWHGESDWHGSTPGQEGDEPAVQGPMISIRHPKWTAEEPRQDIPIMIFTRKEWRLVKDDKLTVSAAPIGPGEMGRNSNYVFALPARYNYAFATGYEEVDKIPSGAVLCRRLARQRQSKAADGGSNQQYCVPAVGVFATQPRLWLLRFFGLATLPVGVGILLSVLHWMSFDEGSTEGSLVMLFGMVHCHAAFCGDPGRYDLWDPADGAARQRALIVLSAISIVCGGGLIVLMPYTPGWDGGPDSPMVDYGMGIAFGIYVTANIVIPAWWFTKGRRRYKGDAFAPEGGAHGSPSK